MEVGGEFNLARQGAGARSNGTGSSGNRRGPDDHHLQFAGSCAGWRGRMDVQPALGALSSLQIFKIF
jgi:hypothetical protein